MSQSNTKYSRILVLIVLLSSLILTPRNSRADETCPPEGVCPTSPPPTDGQHYLTPVIVVFDFLLGLILVS